MMVDNDSVGCGQDCESDEAVIASLEGLDPATTDLVYTVTDRATAPGRSLQCTVVASASGVEVSVDLFGTARAEASESIDPDTWRQLISRASELIESSSQEASGGDADAAACTTELAIRTHGRTAFSVTATNDLHEDRGLINVLRTLIDPAIAHVDVSTAF